jgi:uncharacterized protein
MKNAVNWFEIPATDFDRACTFYATVLGKDIQKGDFMGVPHGYLSFTEPGVGGAVVKYESGLEPAANGVRIFLDVSGDIDGAEARVEAAGGRVLMPKTSIGEQGFIVLMIDSEGNQMGLHSTK